MKNSRFLSTGFWIIITLVFLYDRRILIEKTGLPHLIECLVVRVGLLVALSNFHFNYLVPEFFQPKRYFRYSSTLLLAVLVYVAIQQWYDIYLYNFVLGASIPKTFTSSFPYTFITTCWYLAVTVAFQLSLKWYRQQPAPAKVNKDLVRLKTGNQDVDLPINDILYVQGLKDYSIIYTASEKIVAYGNLRSMERRLPGNEFQRVHKSYLVAVNKITRKEKSKMWINLNEIPIGRTYKKKD